MECSVYGCIKGTYAKGLCFRHYEQERLETAPPCSIKGCHATQKTKGLCSTHYRAKLREDAPPCKIEGCGRPVICRGLCDAHRLREDHHGHLDPTRPEQWGSKSKHPLYNTWTWMKRKEGYVFLHPEWKDDFWLFTKDVGEKPSSKHKLCRKVDEAGYIPENMEWREIKITAKDRAEYARKWRANNPKAVINADLKKLYGSTIKQYEEMLNEQNGVCEICGGKEKVVHPKTQRPRRLAVDHCHKTGKVRGLLCTNCNAIIGHANDSIELLQKAIQYIISN